MSQGIQLLKYEDNWRDAVLGQKLYDGIMRQQSSLRMCQELSFAISTSISKFLNCVAGITKLNVHRIREDQMVLDSPDIVAVLGNRNRDQKRSTCVVTVWGKTEQAMNAALEEIAEIAKQFPVTQTLASIFWAHGHPMDRVMIEEEVDDALHDEAYPEIAGGINAMISAFLDSPDTVLVLQGPPGTGKTRLIRAIICKMTKRKGDNAHVLYTCDTNILQRDEVFVEFATGDEDAFVIEDADYVLKPRPDGNDSMHRFLNVADGLIRAQHRKIIFSTNLTNIGDLDSALVRPGRCFARIFTRNLNKDEASKLLRVLCGNDEERTLRAIDKLPSSQHNFALADVYRAKD